MAVSLLCLELVRRVAAVAHIERPIDRPAHQWYERPWTATDRAALALYQCAILLTLGSGHALAEAQRAQLALQMTEAAGRP
jgi:fructoselysine-6-P-deglycase FrlB-like protein